jgi:hypothetical protein
MLIVCFKQNQRPNTIGPNGTMPKLKSVLRLSNLAEKILLK